MSHRLSYCYSAFNLFHLMQCSNYIAALSEEDKRNLLDRATGTDRIILLLLFETGLDLERLINLRVSDLDLRSGRLNASPAAPICLSSAANEEIRQYLASRPGQVHLLEGRCGKPVTSKWRSCVLEGLMAQMEKAAVSPVSSTALQPGKC